MVRAVNKVIGLIDKINQFIGYSVSWLSGLLVVVIVVDVSLRYLFSITSAASFELEWHLFAILFMISAGWALQENRHVRVDLFYQNFSEKGKAWVNFLGSLFLLIPFCVISISESIGFVLSSYALAETSADPGGLSARYLIKSTIPIGFFLLLLQGIREIMYSLIIILNQRVELKNTISPTR